MTDSPDLTPEHDAVRRLLAEARHDGPTPPEVVARLDETLASLVAERSAEASAAPVAPVVDLAARRRRLVGAGVLAAAAVVVAGVALGQVLPVGQGGSDAGSSADSSTASSGTERELGAEDDAGGTSSSQEMAPQSKSAAPTPLAGQPTLSTDDPRLQEQVQELRGDQDFSAGASRRQTLDLMRSCPVPELPRGRRVAAEVDGQPGVVLYQRPEGAAQDVAIYVCGTPEPVRTLTLPAP